MNTPQSNPDHLRKKLLHLLLYRLLIPMLLFTVVFVNGAGYVCLKNLENQQRNAVESLAQTAERYLGHGVRNMSAISAFSEDFQGEQWRHYLSDIWESYGYFETVYMIDDTYTVQNLIPFDKNMVGLDLSNMPDMRSIPNGSTAVISSPFISLRTGDPTVYIIRQIATGGMAVGELNLSILQQEIKKEQGKRSGNVVYVMDQSGTLLAHPDINQVKQQMNMSRLAVFEKSKDADATMFYKDSGTFYLGSTTQVAPVNWTVVAQLPVLALFAPFLAALAVTLVVFLLIWLGVFNNLRKNLQGNVVDPLYQEFSRENEERLKAEEMVHETESRFQAIFNQTYQFIGLIDQEGRLLESNQAIRQFSGADPSGERGQYFWDTAVWRHSRQVQEQIRLAVAKALDGAFVRQEVTAVSAAGELHTLDFSLKPVLAADGSVTMIIPEGRDITELKQAEAALQQINEQLEERVAQRTQELEALNVELEAARIQAERASKAKTSFLASMSHELRTPLNAILGFSELMSTDDRLPSDTIRNLQIINRSGDHLLTLINDVLDLSKIESGLMELDVADMDLHKMVQGLHDLLRVRAEKKGLQLDIELSKDVPKRIRSDERKLRQVLLNLMGNALKYTDQGRITLLVSTLSAGTEGAVLRFAVSDTGSGISREEQEHLFKEYFQASRGRQTEESTGLGLSIAASIVNLLGGSIAVASEPNIGSTFSFDIQVALPKTGLTQGDVQRKVSQVASGTPAMRVLIVDDEPNNSLLLTQLLNKYGLETRTASNGIEGLKQWEDWHPHLILMDIHMPMMDGYETTRHIRFRENSDGAFMHTVIVGISASCFNEDRDKILTAGCDDFMMKPFTELDLCMMLTKHLGIQFSYTEVAGPPETELRERPQYAKKALARLPKEQLYKLTAAASNLETQDILQAIDAIRLINPTLAEVLSEKAAEFEYDTIFDWAKSALENS